MFTNRVNMGVHKFWHPWFGCKKVSPACMNCFVKNFSTIEKGQMTIPKVGLGGVIVTCLHSDFFIEGADTYREEAWQVIREHPDNIFLIITKRVERIKDCLPEDWGAGYENVVLSVTVETQDLAEKRIPVFMQVPAKHKWLSCCPLIEPLNLESFLSTGAIEWVETCGESGDFKQIRPTRYEWVKSLSEQCKRTNVRFTFMKIGGKFIKDGTFFGDRTSCYHSPRADACNLDNAVPVRFTLSGKEFTIK